MLLRRSGKYFNRGAHVPALLTGAARAFIGEPGDGLSVDFTYPVEGKRVAIKSGDVITEHAPDALFTLNNPNGPKLVFNSVGQPVYSPHNFFLNSDTPATQGITVTIGRTYTLTITGTGSISTSGAGVTGTATEGSPLHFIPTSSNVVTFTVSGTITTAQLVRGMTPAVYVPAAGVVRYYLPLTFDPTTLEPLGLWAERTLSTPVIWNRAFHQTAWVKTNITSARTATGYDGFPNGASRLTATADGGTVLQTTTSASGIKLSSVFIKRVTGTGTVEITQDNGATWTPVTVTGSYTRVVTPAQTLTNPVVGLRLGTSGDEIDVDYFQVDLLQTSHQMPSSPMEVPNSVVTRANDTPNILVTQFPFNAETLTLFLIYAHQFGSADWVNNSYGGGTTSETASAMTVYNGGGVNTGLIQDAGVTQAQLLDTASGVGEFVAVGFGHQVNNMAFVKNGGTIRTDLSATIGTSLAVTRLYLGSSRVGGGQTYVKKALLINRRMSNTEIQQRARMW